MVPNTQSKPVVAELDSLANVGAGSPAQLTNMPTGWFGYEGAGDPFQNYERGAVLLAQKDAPAGTLPGGLFLVTEDTAGNLIALMIVDASQLASLGAKVRYLVAQTGTPQALPGTFATPQAAITQAVADRSAATVPVDILVLPGSYAGFVLEPNVHVSSLQGAANAVTITGTISFTAGAAAGTRAQVSGMTISTGANSSIDGTNAANYEFEIQNCPTSNSSGANPTINMVAGASLAVSDSRITNAAGQAMSTAVTVTSTNSIWTASSATSCIAYAANVTITMEYSAVNNGTNPSFSGAAGTLIQRGPLPGVTTVVATISYQIDRSSGVLPLEQTVNDADATVNGGTELMLITLVATNRTITLPPTSTQPPLKELILMRRDNVPGTRCTVQPNAADSIVPGPGLGLSIRLAPGDTLRLMARRGSNEWIRVP